MLKTMIKTLQSVKKYERQGFEVTEITLLENYDGLNEEYGLYRIDFFRETGWYQMIVRATYYKYSKKYSIIKEGFNKYEKNSSK